MNRRWMSRYLCYVLRHSPEDLGIELDERGWTEINVLLERLSAVKQIRLGWAELERLVRQDRWRRYSIKDGRLRANEGHTVESVRLVFERADPPSLLYYGLPKARLFGILGAGALEPSGPEDHMIFAESAGEADQRLSCNYDDQPYIIVVEALKAARNGVQFYRSESGAYVCDSLPTEYFLDQRPDFRFQVSAGGVVVRGSEDDHPIAVMRTRKRWELPKGKLRKGERGWEAAQREVQEELGLEGRFRVRQRLDRVLYFFRNRCGQPRLKTVLLFLIQYKGPEELRPRVSEGVLAAEWVSFAEAKKRLLCSGGRYLRALETAEWVLRTRYRKGLSTPEQ